MNSIRFVVYGNVVRQRKKGVSTPMTQIGSGSSQRRSPQSLINTMRLDQNINRFEVPNAICTVDVGQNWTRLDGGRGGSTRSPTDPNEEKNTSSPAEKQSMLPVGC